MNAVRLVLPLLMSILVENAIAQERVTIALHDEGRELRIYPFEANCLANRVDIRPEERTIFMVCFRPQDMILLAPLPAIPRVEETRELEALKNWRVTVNQSTFSGCNRVVAIPADLLPMEVGGIEFQYTFLCNPDRIAHSSFEE